MLPLVAQLQHRQERLLGHLDALDLLHPLAGVTAGDFLLSGLIRCGRCRAYVGMSAKVVLALDAATLER